jgi:enoyl-CoA hydratase
MSILEENTVLSAKNGAVWELTINRPESLNALNPDVLQTLLIQVEKIARDPDLRVVILTGSGPKAFVAGADISSMSGLGSRPIADYVELGQRTMRALESLAVPVIAAVNGFALGGGLELALACDLIMCADTAKVGQPEVNLGILPGFGGTQRLIQRCGIGTARRLCYLGELIAADEARLLGIVDKVVPPERLMEEARAWATAIAGKAPLAIKGTKRVITHSQEAILLQGLRLEVEEFLRLFASADREEGMTAFLQKRPARFTGR